VIVGEAARLEEYDELGPAMKEEVLGSVPGRVVMIERPVVTFCPE